MDFTTREELIEFLQNSVQPYEKLAWQLYTKADVASNIGCDVEEITDERFEVVHRWLGEWDILFDDIGSAEDFDDYMWER